jgi:hypothetical protein
MTIIAVIRNSLSYTFRKRRMNQFMRFFEINDETKILDVGGTPYNWQIIHCPAQITLLNLTIPNPLPNLPSNMKYIQGDGMNLQFADKSFDIVFSNSVIEHLFTLENQKKFALEVERVGKSLWIQTPARSFFFEPHFLAPFFQFLSKNSQVKLARNFTLWGWLARPSQENVLKMVSEIHLLTKKELQSFLPNCVIYKEKFFGLLTKSYIAIKE